MAESKLLTVEQAKLVAERVKEAITAAINDMVITVNTDTGNLEYESSTHTLNINNETGNLEYETSGDSV